MGNTFFYNEIQKGSSRILWKDLFSESFQKHSEAERTYAMNVGTPLNHATEADMLQKWHKPFLWVPVAKAGIAFAAIIYFLVFVCFSVFSVASDALITMMIIIPPVIIPVVILILLWELNIPQNISLMELLAYTLLGGVLSFAVNSPFFLIVQGEAKYLAAFREEPAKLAAALIIVVIASQIQHKKIYGITALVIGAAVGTGFSAFESITYAMSAGTIAEVITTQLLRAVVAPGGHVAYCAVYMAALFMTSSDGRIHASGFLSPGFIMSFIASSLAHAMWNGVNSLWICPVVIVAMWALMLYWIRQCMLQVLKIGTAAGGGYWPSFYTQGNQFPDNGSRPWEQSAGITVTCIGGLFNGRSWNGSGVIIIGRDESCTVTLPSQSPGVSRQHCSIQRTGRGWTIRDLNSTYGTYLSSGKLLPGRDYEIRDGERIYLGSRENVFSIRLR